MEVVGEVVGVLEVVEVGCCGVVEVEEEVEVDEVVERSRWRDWEVVRVVGMVRKRRDRMSGWARGVGDIVSFWVFWEIVNDVGCDVGMAWFPVVEGDG